MDQQVVFADLHCMVVRGIMGGALHRAFHLKFARGLLRTGASFSADAAEEGFFSLGNIGGTSMPACVPPLPMAMGASQGTAGAVRKCVCYQERRVQQLLAYFSPLGKMCVPGNDVGRSCLSCSMPSLR